MGKSSDQVIGYRYFTNFLLFIGNPIEKLLGINFDKRGWLTPLVDENGNSLSQGFIDSPTLYGETEGGVSGAVYLKTGANDQEVVLFYKDYMESKELQASAYPYQSYLAFKDFYVGNSGYMKEMLLWPKRTRIRNDGRRQWYEKNAKGQIVCEIGAFEISEFNEDFYNTPVDFKVTSINQAGDSSEEITEVYVPKEIVPESQIAYASSGKFYFGSLDISKAKSTAKLQILSADIRGIVDVEANIVTHGKHVDITHHGIFNVVIETTNASEYEGKYKLTGKANIKDEISISVVASEKITVASPELMDYLGAAVSFYISNIASGWDIKLDAPDINPIHKIREILTDDTAMNKPEASVNEVNFIKAADRIWGEGLGVSWSITEKSCIEAINELCYHIESGIRVNRQTGLYEMVLFRDNWFEESEIHTIPESKIKSMQYEITNADEVINQVNVNFYDRANIKNSSFSISESGLIQTLGRVNAETLDFPYFMNMRNAEIVANWKLKQLSTGVFKGSFTTGWRDARKWNRYDLIRLPWSKRWSGTILVRIMSINLGGPTNNEVSIDFIEVVPSTGMMNTSIVADDPIDKPLPPQACQYEPFEMPYYLVAMRLGQRQVDEELAYDSNFGLVGVVAEKPQENSLYAVMMTNNYDEWVRAGSIQYSLTADSDQIISKTSSSFTVKNWKKISNVPVGTLIQCGREWLTGFVEWMVFQGVDPYTGIVSVKRGVLDTQPQDWDLGLKLYFCGTDISYDQTEYVSGEKVLVSALTTTPSGVLEQKGSNAVDMKARAIRPYPPANVKINGAYWPTEVEGDLTLTWVDRNRLQQTGGEILDWFDGGVTLENGVNYQLILTEIDENQIELRTQSINIGTINNYTLLASSMQEATHTIEVTLKTFKNNFECLQPFMHRVLTGYIPPGSAPVDLLVGGEFIGNANQGNIILNTPASAESGDLLIAIIYHRPGASISAPEGFENIGYHIATGVDNSAISVFSAPFNGGANYQFSIGAEYRTGSIIAVRGSMINSEFSTDTVIDYNPLHDDSCLIVYTFGNGFSNSLNLNSLIDAPEIIEKGVAKMLFGNDAYYEQKACMLNVGINQDRSVAIQAHKHDGRQNGYSFGMLVFEVNSVL